jgi:protein-S-isoprenylcysteine O-methyltransferase Ste14
MKNENVKIQTPVLALIFVALAFVLGLLIPLPLVIAPVMRTLGFILAILGFLLGLAALLAFRQARQRSNKPGLVTTGIYRFSRNPVAFGFVLMLIGLPLNAGSVWGVILTPAMVVTMNLFVIGPEEKFLTNRYGEDYKTYLARVRRWL